MVSAVTNVRSFVEAFCCREDLEEFFWDLYACAIQSELADHWDGKKRLDVFWLLDALIGFLADMDKLSDDLRPIWNDLEMRYKAREKRTQKK